MTQDEIIKMARQAGFILEQPSLDTWCALGNEFEAFAKLVAVKEREEIDQMVNDDSMLSDNDAIRLSRAIRARGEA